MEDKITLEFDNGETQVCAIRGVFDYNKKDYIALDPLNGSDDVYIYGYKEKKDGSYDIFDVQDDEEFKSVVAEFDSIMGA